MRPTAAVPGDLLDEVLEKLPETPREGIPGGGPRRVALVGKPNVGKSSLLNKLSGDERSVVHNVAGTTVDPVDSIVELGGRPWRFVDTAGLRKSASAMPAERSSMRRCVRRARSRAAEVAILLIDSARADHRAGPACSEHGGRHGDVHW